MGDDIPFSPRAHEKVGVKERHEMAHTLSGFGKYAVALWHLMDQGKSFTHMDVLFIENHSQVVQMALIRWKRKQTPVSRKPG